MSKEDRLSDSNVVRVDPDDAVVQGTGPRWCTHGTIDIPRRTSSRSTWRDGHTHRYIVLDEQSYEGEDMPSKTEIRSLQMHQIM